MPIGITILAASGIATTAYLMMKMQRAKLREAWSSAAALLGAEFIPEAGAWYQKKIMEIRALVDGVGVLVDHYTVSTGKSSTTYTRLKATPSGPPDLHLGIHKEGFFSSLGKAFGTQDVIIGEQTFDDKFIIKASDEEICKAWINSDIQNKILDVSDYSFQIKKNEVTVTKLGIEENPQMLVAVIRATAAFANGGKKIIEKLSATAQELRGSLSSEPNVFIAEKTQVEWVHRNFSFVLEFVSGNEKIKFQKTNDLMTCVKARHLGRGATFYLSKNNMPKRAESLPTAPIQDREFGLEHTLRTDNADVGNLFNQELTTKLQGLSFAGISSDTDFVTMWFSGLVSDAAVLEKASAALSLLATSPELDPYR
jgi:hypothetical protein